MAPTLFANIIVAVAKVVVFVNAADAISQANAI